MTIGELGKRIQTHQIPSETAIVLSGSDRSYDAVEISDHMGTRELGDGGGGTVCKEMSGQNGKLRIQQLKTINRLVDALY